MISPSEDPTTNVPIISQSSGLSGIKWVGQSFSIFGKSPSIWVVMLVIYFGICFLLTKIPLLVLMPTLMAPIFNAGFVYGARAVDNQQMLEIDHLFAGFKLQLRGLFRLGMYYFLMNLLVIALVSIFMKATADPNAILAMSQATTTAELEQILFQYPDLVSTLFKSILLGVIMSIPLVMASWFSPALVLFHQIPPLRAMLISIKACNKNILAFLFYGFLIIPLLVLALLPFGLGLLIGSASCQ